MDWTNIIYLRFVPLVPVMTKMPYPGDMALMLVILEFQKGRSSISGLGEENPQAVD